MRSGDKGSYDSSESLQRGMAMAHQRFRLLGKKMQRHLSAILLTINCFFSLWFLSSTWPWSLLEPILSLLKFTIWGIILFIMPIVTIAGIIFIFTKHYSAATLTCFFVGLMTVPLGALGIIAGIITYRLWKEKASIEDKKD